MNSIFSGVRVIDITKVFSGPFATRMLADYGAEVLKIENRKNPDDSRNFPPIKNNWSGYYEILNRNKKGIALNLKEETDLQKLYTLVKNADVFVENLTPSTKYKLKVDYQTLRDINPQIIYASLSGISQDSDRKYYDVIAQAESGLMSLSGYPNEPMKIGPSVVDAFSGMTLAFSIASALFYREKTKKGQYVDVSMLSCSMNLLESNLIDYSITQKNPTRVGNHDNAISPFGVYKTKNAYIVIAIGNENLWNLFLGFLQKHKAVDEKLFNSNIVRLKNNQRLTETIEGVFSRFSTDEISTALTELNIPHSKVCEMSDVYADANNYKRMAIRHINHSKLGNCVVPGNSIRFSQVDISDLDESPEIGEDNEKYGL